MLRPDDQVKLDLDQGHTMLVTGPLDLQISEGSAECFGAQFKSNIWVHVEGLRQEPILARDKCIVRVNRGPGGSWKIVPETTIPASWRNAGDTVRQSRGTIVVVGDVDSGKSSLCTFIANICVKNGLNVGIVDADVGQADLGPPTTISSARVSSQVFSLQELNAETSFFLGDISPASVSNKLIGFLKRLKQDASQRSDVVLINTDGWVEDSAAIRLKENIVHETEPDLVIGLDKSGEIEPLLSILPAMSMRLSSSSYVRARSKDQRKDAREAGYRRFLAGSRVVKVRRDITDSRWFDQPSQSILNWSSSFRGLIVGLLDGEEKLLGLGRIREMSEGSALVETNAKKEPKSLELGNILLSSDYEETGYWTLH